MSDDTPERPPRAVPDPDGRNADFYRHAATGALHLQRCSDCGRYQHPPRYLCAACRSEGLEWVPVSGRGRVFSWTVTHRPIDPAWTDGPPFATLVVELAEGVRVVGALRGLPTEKLRLDLPVVAELEPVSEAFAFIHFRPEAG